MADDNVSPAFAPDVSRNLGVATAPIAPPNVLRQQIAPPPAGVAPMPPGVRGTNPAVQNLSIPAEGRALLATIGSQGFESNGSYTQRFNQPDFTDFAAHPATKGRITRGPNRGNVSDAAGRYQFLSSTWKEQANKLGLKDFSPQSQDAAAWNLAKETYAKSGKNRDLARDLQNPGKLTQIARALKSKWTSLPGGMEQRGNFKKFSQGYSANLAQARTAGVASAPPLPPPTQGIGIRNRVFSSDPWLQSNLPATGPLPPTQVGYRNPLYDRSQ